MSLKNMCIPGESLPTRDSEEDCCKNFPFQDLVFDIQIYIISCFIPPPDLTSLALVCRHLNSLVVPVLYTEIRLIYVPTLPLGGSRAARVFTKTLVAAQENLCYQLLKRAERAHHVRTLAWQFCSNSGPTFENLFPLLDNLRKVHLVDPHPTHIDDLDLVIPPLFPRIEEIKLAGTTYLSFVLPILHSPQRITVLSLDTIQPHTAALGVLELVSKADVPHLRTLSLRAYAQESDTQPWDVPKENELLAAWKEALSAVQLSVENITLGFRTNQTAPPKSYIISPSAERFSHTVLPVFWEVDWPTLKMLHLEGIHIDAAGRADHAARLRASLPNVVVRHEIRGVPRFWNSESVDTF